MRAYYEFKILWQFHKISEISICKGDVVSQSVLLHALFYAQPVLI